MIITHQDGTNASSVETQVLLKGWRMAKADEDPAFADLFSHTYVDFDSEEDAKFVAAFMNADGHGADDGDGEPAAE